MTSAREKMDTLPSGSHGLGFDLRIRDVEKEARSVASGKAAHLAPQNFVTPGTIITQEVGFMR
jgi:hypothetical protein